MATINLYSSSSSDQWDLLPNKLFIIDDIADYLLTKTKTTLNSIQYQKNQLELTLKLDMSQSYAQADSVSNYKYVSIQNNADERIHYYFVRKVTWRSKTCVEFDLLLDVLNTFHETTDYVFKSNTKIVREHKDRYVRGLYEIIISVDYLPTKTGDVNEGDHVSLISRFDQKVMFSGTITEISLGFSVITIEVDGEYFDKLATIKADLAAHENHPYSLDVTNDDYLLYSAIIENDYTFNEREHRVIDYVKENINPLLVHYENEDLTIENPKSVLQQNWYLLYRNQNNPDDSLVNPVECYLIPEEAVNVDSGIIMAGKLTGTALTYGKYYYFRIYEENLLNVTLIEQKITLPNGDVYDGDEINGSSTNVDAIYGFLSRNAGGGLNLRIMIFNNGTPDVYKLYKEYNDIEYIQLDTLPFKYVEKNNDLYSAPYLSSIWDDEDEWTNTGTYNLCLSIKDLDKTDAKNIKLIKLPYAPYNFNISSDVILVSTDPNWDFTYFTQSNNINFYALKLHDLNTKLSGEFNLPLGAQVFNRLGGLHLNPSLTYSRDNSLEPKIYHSEFYNPSFVYDSFMLKIELEKCDLKYYLEENSFNATTMKFTASSTINSRFMVSIPNYKCKFAEVNFYNMFTIARNNEEVLYNVPYINYIRNGFNYDVKNKNIQNASNWAGATFGIVGGTAAALAGAMTSNPLAVLGGVVTIVSSLKNAITSQAQSENNLAAKLEQLRNQTASAAGSDDIDLMSIYAKNRVIFMSYKPNEVMTNMLYDLFFYGGYASGRMGIPNHTRRVNFDYLECEAKIESVATIPEECLNELIACFATGVTYIHKTTRTSKKWDVKQEYENWETSLMGE